MVVRDRLVADRHHLPLGEEPEQLPVDALEALVAFGGPIARAERRERLRIAREQPVAAPGGGHEDSLRLDRAACLGRGPERRRHTVGIFPEDVRHD